MLKFESAKDDLVGLQNMTVTYILDPELVQDPGAESSTDEVWDVVGLDDEGNDEDE